MAIVILKRTMQRQGVLDCRSISTVPGSEPAFENGGYRTIGRAGIDLGQLPLQRGQLRCLADFESRKGRQIWRSGKVTLTAHLHRFQTPFRDLQAYDAGVDLLLGNVDIDGSVARILVGLFQGIGRLLDGVDGARGPEKGIDRTLDHRPRQHVIAEDAKFGDVEDILLRG